MRLACGLVRELVDTLPMDMNSVESEKTNILPKINKVMRKFILSNQLALLHEYTRMHFDRKILNCHVSKLYNYLPSAISW